MGDSSEDVDKKKEINATTIAIWATVFVFVFWILNLVLLQGLENRGTFGDMFGGLNALFSGLAFVGLIYAILLQKQELSLQRKELKSTREELAGQRKEQERQNEFIAQQVFENTFFGLLRVHNDIVNSMDLKDPNGGPKAATGRDCFVKFKRELRDIYKSEFKLNPHDRKIDPPPTHSEHKKAVRTAYSKFYKTDNKDLGHYFRSLYNLIKFIDKYSIKDMDKRLYTNIVRAQLSDDEVFILFYNCLSEYGKEKFKPLVEEYSLLKMIREEELFRESDMDYYKGSAFK